MGNATGQSQLIPEVFVWIVVATNEISKGMLPNYHEHEDCVFCEYW